MTKTKHRIVHGRSLRGLFRRMFKLGTAAVACQDVVWYRDFEKPDHIPTNRMYLRELGSRKIADSRTEFCLN